MRAGKGASQGSVEVLSGKTPSKEVGGVLRARRAESGRNSCCWHGRREDEAGRRKMGPEICLFWVQRSQLGFGA